MSKTNDLRKLIQSRLKTVCENVYYEHADDEKLYPHITYEFVTNVNDDLYRSDINLDVDIFDKSSSATLIEDLADDVEKLFNNKNLPQDTILPTFFLIDRKSVPDEDKKIRHRLVRILIQNYERRVN